MIGAAYAATAMLVAFGLAAAWLGALAFLRLRTPLERLHMVAFVNVAAMSALTLAVFAIDGLSSRSLKCALIFVVLLIGGALLSPVTARALHLREGEWR